MANVANWLPSFKYGHKVYPQNMVSPLTPVETGDVWFVDGDKSTGGAGKTWEDAYATIAAAISAASAGDVIYIAAKTITAAATDPVSYEENLTIPNAKSSLSLIGVSRGRTQGGLPQLKDGTTTTQEILRVRAPGCLIANLGFNGAGNTGGSILLDESVSGYNAWGTTIAGCHFKNGKGSTATDCRTGGAIMWHANGGAWQVRIVGNTFYKCVGDIVLKGTSSSVPQDVIIEGNVFSGPATSVDCNVYLAGGSGMASVTVHNNVFPSVLPALSSGSITRYADMTGCTGIFSDNYFGGSYTTTGFGAAKAAAKIPTTVGITHNYSDAGLIVREA